jgi:hypothetical protein
MGLHVAALAAALLAASCGAAVVEGRDGARVIRHRGHGGENPRWQPG